MIIQGYQTFKKISFFKKYQQAPEPIAMGFV